MCTTPSWCNLGRSRSDTFATIPAPRSLNCASLPSFHPGNGLIEHSHRHSFPHAVGHPQSKSWSKKHHRASCPGQQLICRCLCFSRESERGGRGPRGHEEGERCE